MCKSSDESHAPCRLRRQDVQGARVRKHSDSRRSLPRSPDKMIHSEIKPSTQSPVCMSLWSTVTHEYARIHVKCYDLVLGTVSSHRRVTGDHVVKFFVPFFCAIVVGDRCGRPADVTRLSRSGGMDRLCFMHENSKPADMSPLRATCQVR